MSGSDPSPLLDRIAELTGQLARAEFALGADGAIAADGFPDAIRALRAERDRLRAERDRYRTGLELIARPTPPISDWCQACQDVARVWLTPGPGEQRAEAT